MSNAVAEMLIGIRKGQVPRQVRLFAARGLLPVAREELLRLQALLAADPDEELAEHARQSLLDCDEDFLAQWLQTGVVEPLELEMLVRVRKDDRLWALAARREEVSDETLRLLARHGSALIQDIIVTNQVRVLACMELLEDLRINPALDKVISRRIREFEEEFIRKAIEDEESVMVTEPTPTVSEEVAEYVEIGAHIPEEETMPMPEMAEEPELEGVAEDSEQGLSTHALIQTLNTHGKMMAALKGNREMRGILIQSRNRLVYRAVLASPKLTQLEIERFANSKSVADDVIAIIAGNGAWLRRYSVILALATNPKTPIRKSLGFLPRLSKKDLVKVSKDRNVPGQVRRVAKNMVHSRQ